MRTIPHRTSTTLTTTEAAVLALLAIEGEHSAYDLTKLVATAIGYVWAPAKTQLYAVLPRLAAAGHLAARATREGARPEKQLYRITRDGRAALDRWLEAEPESLDAFQLKLFVGGLTTTEVLLRHLEWFRRTIRGRLDEYRAVEPTNTRESHDFFHYFSLRMAIERSEQLLAWADWVEAELGRQGRR